MSENYKVIDSTVPAFITITVVDWLDLLVRPVYCNIIDDSLNYCIKEKGLSIHAYVYMSSYRNYEEDNTVFCNVNVEPLW